MRRQPAAVSHLHLAVRAAGLSRPGHDVVAAVDFAPFVTLLEEGPDRLIVLGREREIAAAPFGTTELRHESMTLIGLRFPGRGRDR